MRMLQVMTGGGSGTGSEAAGVEVDEGPPRSSRSAASRSSSSTRRRIVRLAAPGRGWALGLTQMEPAPQRRPGGVWLWLRRSLLRVEAATAVAR